MGNDAPRCRCCGKLLRKQTTYHLFRDPVAYRPAGTEEFAPGHTRPVQERLEKPEGHRERERGSGSWLIYTANRPRTKAECQRFTNYPVTSIRRHYDNVTIGSFTAWDGESYHRSYRHFCTNDCAAKFGRAIADRGKITVRRRPCGSCPYRRDVPSGVWAAHEYEKLPAYDGSTVEQLVNGATGVFLCHSTPDQLCAGWVGCHDMEENLALRFEAARGTEIDPAVFTYESPIPLWASGAEACAHGVAEIDDPSEEAVSRVQKLSPVVAARPKRFRKGRP